MGGGLYHHSNSTTKPAFSIFLFTNNWSTWKRGSINKKNRVSRSFKTWFGASRHLGSFQLGTTSRCSKIEQFLSQISRLLLSEWRNWNRTAEAAAAHQSVREQQQCQRSSQILWEAAAEVPKAQLFSKTNLRVAEAEAITLRISGRSLTQDRTKTLKPYKNLAAVHPSLYPATRTTSLTPMLSRSSQVIEQLLTRTKIGRSKFNQSISPNLMT